MSLTKSRHKSTEYTDVFKELYRAKIQYLLIGGMAVILYGVPRVTGDLDLMLQMDSKNLLSFISVMKKLGYKPKVPVKAQDFSDPKKREKWIKNKNMKVFSFIHLDDPYAIVDVMIDNPIDFEQAYKKREEIEQRGVKISVAAKEDVIALKNVSARPQDLSDIILLRRILKSEKK
jgi:predicted nucleotidyltransferase